MTFDSNHSVQFQSDLPGDEHDEVASIEDADHDEDDAHPEADPQPEGQVL